MTDLGRMSIALIQGKKKDITAMVQQALDDGIDAEVDFAGT